MTYNISISETAEMEMKSISDYISDVLHSPQSAYNLMREMQKQIRALNQMPKRYPLVFDERLAKMGIRSMPVKNYSIFYIVSEQENTVTIISVMYNRRDWANLL